MKCWAASPADEVCVESVEASSRAPCSQTRPSLLPSSSASPQTTLTGVPFWNEYRPSLSEDEPLLSDRTVHASLPATIFAHADHFQLRTSGRSSPCSET